MRDDTTVRVRVLRPFPLDQLKYGIFHLFSSRDYQLDTRCGLSHLPYGVMGTTLIHTIFSDYHYNVAGYSNYTALLLSASSNGEDSKE